MNNEPDHNDSLGQKMGYLHRPVLSAEMRDGIMSEIRAKNKKQRRNRILTNYAIIPLAVACTAALLFMLLSHLGLATVIHDTAAEYLRVVIDSFTDLNTAGITAIAGVIIGTVYMILGNILSSKKDNNRSKKESNL